MIAALLPPEIEVEMDHHTRRETDWNQDQDLLLPSCELSFGAL